MASANQNALDTVGKHYGSKFRKTRRPITQSSTNVAKKSVQAIGHQGQALILIMMLTGVDLVKQHFEHAGIKRERIDKIALLKQSGEAAEHILSSGEIWASIAGAGLTMGLSKKPLDIINKLIDNSKSRSIFKNILKSGIATLITFVGWEIGGQLFAEARELLEFDEDYQKAESFMSLLISAFKDKSIPDNKQNWDIVKKIMANMWKIVWEDSELRELWIYNTFRKRIATGEFTTLVSSMFLASAIGTTMFPGAGTIAGLMFGLAGGVASIYIPTKYKDKITSKLRSFRQGFWKLGLDGHDQLGLMNYRENVIRIAYEHLNEGKQLPPLLKFAPKTKGFERMITVYFEKMIHFESVIQKNKALAILAQQHKNNTASEEKLKLVQSAKEGYYKLLNDVTATFSREYEYILDITQKYPLSHFTTKSNTQIINKVEQHLDTRKRTMEFFVYTLVPSIRKEMDSKIESKSYYNSIQRFYLFGFNEKLLLDFI